MKKLLRSTFGTLVVAAFLAIAPPMYARGGHGGGHGGHRGHGGGHAVRGHAAAGHVRGGHAGFRARGGRGHQFARAARGNAAHFAGRARNWNGGRTGNGRSVTGEAITGIRPMDILGSAITVRAMAIHTTDLFITVRLAIRTTGIGYTDTTLTATDTGPASVTFSFGY